MNTQPFSSINYPCNDALQLIRKQLTQAGLHSVQTFNLHTALAGLHDCSCPNHRTDDCDCQIVILLVYGEFEEPVTLILHGNYKQTWLSMSDFIPTENCMKLANLIKNKLTSHFLVKS